MRRWAACENQKIHFHLFCFMSRTEITCAPIDKCSHNLATYRTHPTQILGNDIQIIAIRPKFQDGKSFCYAFSSFLHVSLVVSQSFFYRLPKNRTKCLSRFVDVSLHFANASHFGLQTLWHYCEHWLMLLLFCSYSHFRLLLFP